LAVQSQVVGQFELQVWAETGPTMAAREGPERCPADRCEGREALPNDCDYDAEAPINAPAQF
jgi:hypothetical protein